MPISAIKPKGSIDKRNVISPGSIVEYEQHGRGILAVAISEAKGKWKVVNIDGAELQLASARLYLLPGTFPDTAATLQKKLEYLKGMEIQVAEKIPQVLLADVWETVEGLQKELSVEEMVEIALVDNNLVNHLAVRHALFEDKIFFKRKKEGYEPRPPEVVEELKIQAAVQSKKFERQILLKQTLLNLLKDNSIDLPDEIFAIEKIAALGTSAPVAKEIFTVLDQVLEEGCLPTDGKPEKKAFRYLEAVKHFTQHQNLSAIRLGRTERFSSQLLKDASDLALKVLDPLAEIRVDLRSLTTFTIDDETTEDIDDALSIERIIGGYRIGIHITDVASLITPGSELEIEALNRGTSIYFPEGRIPMLPPQVSEGAFSLFPGVDRLATTFYLDLDDEFNILDRKIVASKINVRHRLTYNAVDTVLYQDPVPQPLVPPEIEKDLELLWGATCAFESRRAAAGAIQFSRREMSPKLDANSKVYLESADFETPGHKLVGEMMIIANETAALFASSSNAPLAYRTQEAPDVNIEQQCLDIPEGPARDYCQRSFLKRSNVLTKAGKHFGLGLEAYSQLTSPIRRATDLINQRQINSILKSGVSHYTEEEFSLLLSQIETRVSEGMQLQRERNRYWLFQYLKQEGIKELNGIVTRIDGMKPIAEVDVLYLTLSFNPLRPKKAVTDTSSVKLGEIVKLRIERLDPQSDTIRLVQIPD